MIRFADRGHPLNSINRRRGVGEKQVKRLLLAGGYIHNLGQAMLFYNEFYNVVDAFVIIVLSDEPWQN